MRQCVSLRPALCESCASTLEANLAPLGLLAAPKARALALHCLTLPPEQRAPVLAVLHQLGVQPYHVTIDYPQLVVTPRAWAITCTTRKRHEHNVSTWREALDYATRQRAAIRWPLADVSGDAPTHFEHLIGLPQPPLVWQGAPLQLDVIETRPNVAVLCLHAGDKRPLVPDTLRYLLRTSEHMGVLCAAPNGYLIATRRMRAGADTMREFEWALGSLVDFRLLAEVSMTRLRALYPWDHFAPSKAPDDLTFALDVLGPHGACTVDAASPYETMRRLAPALLALGLTRRAGNGMTFEDARGMHTVHPWASRFRHKTLHSIVKLAHKLTQ